MITARLSGDFFASLGFSRDEVYPDAWVLEVRERIADDDVGYRLRFMPIDATEWTAEAASLGQSFAHGIGWGRYVTTTEVVELLEAMQIRLAFGKEVV